MCKPSSVLACKLLALTARYTFYACITATAHRPSQRAHPAQGTARAAIAGTVGKNAFLSDIRSSEALWCAQPSMV